jgi:hypothetical protein
MKAKFIGKSTEQGYTTNNNYTFQTNKEYDIETKIINDIILVKDKSGNAFCTYSNIEHFLQEWLIKQIK